MMRAVKRILGLSLMLVHCSIIFSQIAIQGKVVNAKNEAIEFANISLYQQDSNLLIAGTTSDTSGFYELQLAAPGDYILAISFIGYEDFSEPIMINKAKFIGEQQLETSKYLLDEITVTADRGVIENKNGQIVFNVDKSPFRKGFDGLELLQKSPGILTDAEGNLSINNQAPIVQINGRSIQLSGEELLNYLSNLNSDEIQSIQIQRHLSANVRGESAGGLINIILKRKSLGFEGNWRTYYELKRQKKYRAYSAVSFNYGADNWNVYSNFNFSHRTELYEFEATTDYFETENFLDNQRQSFLTRTRPNYRLGFITNLGAKQVIGMEGFGTTLSNKLDIDSEVNFSNQGNYLESGFNYFSDTINNSTNHLLFNYTYLIDTLNSSLKLFADYSNQQSSSKNSSSSVYQSGFFSNLQERNNADSDTGIKSLQADFEKNYVGSLSYAIGVRYTSTQRDNSLLSETLEQLVWQSNDRTSKFEYIENIVAGYVTLKKQFWQTGFLQLGLRVENTHLRKTDQLTNSIITRNYYNWLPDFLYSQEINTQHSFSLAYTRRIRRPPFWRINNSILKLNDFNYSLGNPDLLPELVDRFELGWNRKKQNLRFYYENVADAINGIYFLEGDIAYYKPFNNGRQIQFGAEWSKFGHINSHWYLNGTFGLYNRRFENETNEVSFARNSYYFNLSNNLKINQNLSVDISGYYYSPFEDAFYIAGERFAVNLFLQQALWQKKLTIRLHFNDIFNTLIYTSERPFPNFQTTESNKPRTQFIRLQINYQFANHSNLNKRRNESRNDARERM